MSDGTSDARVASTELADYSVYRSVELGNKIGETLSLVERFKTISSPIVLVTLAVAGLAWLLLSADAAWLRVLGTGYGLIAGLALGVATAAVWLVHSELRRIEELLVLMLDVSERVSRAWAGQDEELRPTPAQLLPPVYAQVFAPMIKQALAKQSRLLGRPLGWVIDGVLHRAVKQLAKLLERLDIGWDWFERRKAAKAAKAASTELPAADPPAPALSAGAERGPDTPGEDAEPREDAAPAEDAEPRELAEPDADAAESDKPSMQALVTRVGDRIRAAFKPVWIGLVALAVLALSPVALVAYLAG